MDEITALVDAVSNGTLRMYNGSRPATGGAATTLLAELTMSATSFAASSGGVLTANAISDDTSADNSGTATWGRLVDSTGAAVCDFDIGTSGSDLNLNTTTIAAGINVAVTSFVLTEGNP
jgi:hypothetical protein